jgi:hypothetical protein
MKDMACPTAGSCKKRSVAMKRLFSTRRGLVVGTAVLGIVSLGVAAFAYWTSSGTGNGSATTASAGAWAVAAPPVNNTDLSPGGSGDTITYYVTNSGNGYQKLSTVDISVASITTPSSNPAVGCTAADFSINGLANAPYQDTALAGEIAGGATVNHAVTLRMVDLASDQNGCQGATVHLAFAAS